MSRNFDAVLFDLDGTLLDTRDLIVESYQYTFKSHMGLAISRESILSRFGHTLVDHFGCYPGADVDAMVQTYRRHNLSRHDDLATLFPGVVEALTSLARSGCQMAVVSSKARKTVLRGLELFELAPFFPVVVCYEDTELHKPHPDPVVMALQQLGAKPSRALMVGDSPFDLIAGREAGTRCASVAWSSFPAEELAAEDPDYILHTAGDIINIVQSYSFSQSRNESHVVENS